MSYTISVDISFDLEIEDEDEACFLTCDDGQGNTDRDLAVWDYLTNWVNGNNDYQPSRPRSAVSYNKMEVFLG